MKINGRYVEGKGQHGRTGEMGYAVLCQRPAPHSGERGHALGQGAWEGLQLLQGNDDKPGK